MLSSQRCNTISPRCSSIAAVLGLLVQAPRQIIATQTRAYSSWETSEAIPMRFFSRKSTHVSGPVTAGRMVGNALLMAVVILMLGLMTPVAFGQASASSDAAGKVIDQTGAAIPGALVHLVNNATGAE